MRLTQYTDYSLRVLIHLATKQGTELTNIKDIARTYNISKNHLMKVIYNLGKMGYIETIRGRNGGIKLCMCPKEINIGEVIHRVEEGFNIVVCFEEEGKCAISDFCSLKHLLNKALTQFLDYLRQYTLDDVVKNNIRLQDYISVNKG